MPKHRQARRVSIAEIGKLYNRAKNHSLYVDEESNKSGSLEAFLMLATLLEGVLAEFGRVLLEKRDDLGALRGKRKDRYGIDNAINDIYLLGAISTDEFKKLEKFKSDRNKCIHEIFAKKNSDEIDKHTNNLFEKHKVIFRLMLQKLEKESPST